MRKDENHAKLSEQSQYKEIIDGLKYRFFELKNENADLHKTAANLREEISQLRQENNQLNLRLDNTESDTIIDKELHRKVSEIVQEVEECIRTLET